MNLSGVKKTGVAYMKQKKAGIPVTEISVSRKRKRKCGRPTPLTVDIALRVMAIQAKNFGKLSRETRRLGLRENKEQVKIQHG